MVATFGSLRRAVACGIFATATIFLGGCFQVEEVADQTDAAGAATTPEEPELNIAMGDDAGPLDLNVDATVGEVSSADFAPSGFGSEAGSNSQVPDAPTAFAPASPTTASPTATTEFAPTTPAPTAFGEPSSAPALASEFAPAAPALVEASPAGSTLQPVAQPATPAPGESFGTEFGSTEFQPPADPQSEGLAALPDQERGAPVAPMVDPEMPLVSDDAATEATAATELHPSDDAPASEEAADPPANVVAEADLEPAADSEEASPELGAATDSGFVPPALAVDASEPEAAAPEATASVPPAELEAPSSPEVVATTPFEEEEFAPLFGPGRRLADASSESEAPATIPTPGPALGPEKVENETPSVLAQESPSPAAEALAMQIFDPSAPPPAGYRPTAQPNAALPAFDPTIGDRLNPPVTLDDEDYTPTPPGAATPGPAAPGPASPAPREIPMPGPARDDSSDEAVPAPPATREVPGSDDRSTPRASTPTEIADAARDWTDASGTHTLKAAILEYDKGEVRLETPKGERFRVTLSSLSRYDQGYVKGLAEGTLGKEAPERTWSDSSGQFSLEGSFVESDGDVVRIAREDGKTFRVEKRELGSYDRGYVDGLADAEQQ